VKRPIGFKNLVQAGLARSTIGINIAKLVTNSVCPKLSELDRRDQVPT
jgi:hypothetical protein